MRKLLIKILTVTCVIMLGLCVAFVGGGCSCSCKGSSEVITIYDAQGTLVFDEQTKSVTVEYGDTYRLPSNIQVDGVKVTTTSVKLFDQAGTEMKLAYGSYTFKAVGNYTVKYVAGEITAEFTVVCVDTVVPEINVVGYNEYGTQGDTVSLPNCTYEDKSGIKEDTIKFTVTAPDGSAVTVTDGEFVLEQIGDYTITVSVEDKNGLTNQISLTTKSMKAYIDESLSVESIYTFNNADYENLVVNVSEGVETSYEIVDAGYPTITNETSDNMVLKVNSNASWKNVNTRFISYDGKKASSGYSVIIKIAFSKDTEYVKLFRNGEDLKDSGLAGQLWGLKANTWYEWEIEVISFGYHAEFKDFIISYRDKGDDMVMYIDEIYFTPYKFVDQTKAENVIADFDEQGYENNMFQNVYCDPTTTRAFRVSGTEFESLPSGDAGIPVANDASGVFPNLGANGGVMKFTVSDSYGGLTYMFPEAIKLDEINTLTFKLYAPIPNYATLIFGFFDELGYDGGNTAWYTVGTSIANNKWIEITFTSHTLQRYTTGGEISGVFLQVKLNEGLSWSSSWAQALYLDEIRVQPKNTPSEQTGDTIASFSSANSLNNVFTPVKQGDASFSYANGALVVKPTLANDLNFTFDYTFDQIVKMAANKSIALNIKTGVASTYKLQVSVYNQAHSVYLIGEYNLTADYVNSYQTLGISGEKILEAIVSGEVAGLVLTVLANTASADNALLMDSIMLYESQNDTVAPTIVSKEDLAVEILEGVELDLSQANIVVSDDKDPNPTWTIIRLLAPDGTDISSSITGKSFLPTVGGEYTLEFKGIDLAGNESVDTQSIKVTVTYILDSKTYYNNRLQFGDASSLELVTTDKGTPELVDDATATDGKAMQATFENGDNGSKRIYINLGGAYKVSEIGSITFSYRLVEAKDVWASVGVNKAPAGSHPNKIDVTSINGSKTTYVTDTITIAHIKAKMGLTNDDTLNSFVIALLDYKPNTTCTILIDYITLNEGDGTQEEALPTGTLNYEKVNFSNTSELAIATSQTGVAPTLIPDATAEDAWALKGTFFNHTGTAQQGKHLVLNMGGYKLGEFEHIKIRFRFETTVDLWPSLVANTVGTDKSKDLLSIQCTNWATYKEQTITSAYIKQVTGLTDDDVLESLIFALIDYKPDDTLTVLIDSLSMYFGDGTADLEQGTVDYSNIEFGTVSEFNLVSTPYDDQAIVADATATDGYALKASFGYTSGGTRQNLTVSLGSVYTIGEIESVTFKYRFESTVNSGDWGSVKINSATDSKGSDVYSLNCGATTYLTRTFTASDIKTATGLTDDDTLDTIIFTMIDPKTGKTYTILIDSIVINEKADVSELLKFDSEEALEVVASCYNNSAAIVTDGTASVLEAQFVHGTSLYISLGGMYKVSDIESITVTYKLKTTNSGDYVSMLLNDSTNWIGKIEAPTAEFANQEFVERTFTVQNLLDKGHTEDTVLTNFIFRMEDWKPSDYIYTVHIDSIVITLKSTT